MKGWINMSYQFESYPLNEYMTVEEDQIIFPKEITVAYAVCSKECGNTEFIVDGSSQVCQYCGKSLFRVAVRKYTLTQD